MKFLAVGICLLMLAGCQSLARNDRVTLAAIDSIKIGDTKSQVRSTLGEPLEVAIYKRVNEEVWTYEHPYPSEGTILFSFKAGDRVTAVDYVPFTTNFSLSD